MSDMTMTTQKIFDAVPCTLLKGASASIEVSALAFSSLEVQPGTLFFCVPGTRVDGHDFAEDAAKRGAAALVVERELELDIAQFLVKDTREALALCSASFYGNPSQKLDLVGITGTNGKTTTTFLVEHIAKVAGKRTGLMGTVECHIADSVQPSLHTTPESRDLQKLLAQMVDAGVDVAALEVSSHAIALDRIAGTHFAVAAFSNLTQDHLDYHKTMENYFMAKARLFTDCDVDKCVICTDSDYGRKLASMAREAGHDVLSVSVAGKADISVEDAQFMPHSTSLKLDVQGAQVQLVLPLVGRFNVENALIAFGICMQLGFAADVVVQALESAPQVPGRLERVLGTSGKNPGFGVLVDYAHTPDSIEKAVAAVKAVTPGRVICVFGCGGDRDATKRPKMGAAALTADVAVVTSDNPRTEDPDAIIEQILPGMQGADERTFVYPDRRQAIRFALRMAHEGDAVLIAGKGHEDYQIIGTTKTSFDDRLVAAEEIDSL